MMWSPDEVNFNDDLRGWKAMSEEEKWVLKSILLFFVQGDQDVHEGYVRKFISMVDVPEVEMMLTMFAAMETVHMDGYAKILETLLFGDDVYREFLAIPEMNQKDRMSNWDKIVASYSRARK